MPLQCNKANGFRLCSNYTHLSLALSDKVMLLMFMLFELWEVWVSGKMDLLRSIAWCMSLFFSACTVDTHYVHVLAVISG